MKKMITGLFSAILMAVSLVGFSAGAAQADCTAYTGCVNTDTKVNAPNDDVARHNIARIRVRVEATAGNAEPSGEVKVVVRRNRDGQVYYREKKAYEGGKIVFISPELHKLGKYTVTAKYKPTDGSVFNSSSDTDTFRVVRQP
jgi:hypothetical protein